MKKNININIVIVGHVDHGKSTLIGRLLYDSATIPEERLAEVQKLIEEYKRRFEFAYFIDSFQEELEEERTIDTTRVLFKGKNYYTIVDVPGHHEFIKNMLTGASHARIAVLVVSCAEGIQQQTRRHAFLVNMLGIRNIIVVINKMDLVDYDEVTFNRLKSEVSEMLAQLGYTEPGFIPVSAMEGDNIYLASTRTGWYRGPTLIEALDGIQIDDIVAKPLRFVVQDVYNVDSESVTVGRVESGVLKKGNELVFQPSGIRAKVSAIKSYPLELNEAQAGDSIGIVIDGKVNRGDVAIHQEEPSVAVSRFLGEIVLLEGSLKQDDRFEIKCGPKKVKCRVEKIIERLSSETGEVIDNSAGEIIANEAATVVLNTEPLVVERFIDIPELGRFVLARDGKNIGAGIVLEVG